MIRSFLSAALVFTAMTANMLAMAGDTDPAIFLVRHAEKQAGPNPSLTDEGTARAERLAGQLENAGIEVIYSTNYHRTQETAAPLAEALDLEITSYDPSDLPGFADHLKSDGRTALVVGHSNTTPALVILLGGEAEPMPETDYDRLYCLSGEETTLLVAGGDALSGPGCP